MPRLTVEQIKEIRKLLQTTDLGLRDIAQLSGTSLATVGRLCYKSNYNRVGWSDSAEFNIKGFLIRKPRYKLNAEKVREIVVQRGMGRGVTALARQFGVSNSTVRAIIEGRIWKGTTARERQLVEHMR